MAGFSTAGAASGAAAGSVIGPWGTVIGGVLGGFFGGGKSAPATAPYTPVDVQAEQTKAVQGDEANEPAIERLLNQSNAFQQQQALSLMEKAMPGYTKLAGQLTGTASSELANSYALPADVQQNLARQSAEMGVSTGRSGQSGDYSLLRDLGVNELQYGQSQISQAQSLTQTLASIAPKVNPMSPLSFYVTPGQAISADTNNNQTQQEIAQGGNNANAAANNANSQSTWQALAGAATANKTAIQSWMDSLSSKNGQGLPTGVTTTFGGMI